ncbi:MAG: hypothetical protein ACLR7P_05310 [Faecalibacterium sp.]
MKRWTRKLLAGLLSFGMLLQAASPLSALAADGSSAAPELTITLNKDESTAQTVTVTGTTKSIELGNQTLSVDYSGGTYILTGQLGSRWTDTVDISGTGSPSLTLKNDSEKAVWVKTLTVDGVHNFKAEGGPNNNTISGETTLTCTGDVEIISSNYAVYNGALVINNAHDVTVKSTGSDPALSNYSTITCSGDIRIQNTGTGQAATVGLKVKNADSVALSSNNSDRTVGDLHVEQCSGSVEVTNSGSGRAIYNYLSVGKLDNGIYTYTASSVTINGNIGGYTRTYCNGDITINGAILGANSSKHTWRSDLMSQNGIVTVDGGAEAVPYLVGGAAHVMGEQVVLRGNATTTISRDYNQSGIKAETKVLTVENTGSGTVGYAKFTAEKGTDYDIYLDKGHATQTDVSLSDLNNNTNISSKYLYVSATEEVMPVAELEVTLTPMDGGTPETQQINPKTASIALGGKTINVAYDNGTYTLSGNEIGSYSTTSYATDIITIRGVNSGKDSANVKLAIIIHGKLVVKDIHDLEVTKRVSVQNSVTCTGNVTMTASMLAQSGLIVNAGGDVILTGTSASITIGKNGTTDWGAEITSGGDVLIENVSGSVYSTPVSGGILVHAAKNVTIKSSSQFDLIRGSEKADITADTLTIISTNSNVGGPITFTPCSGSRDGYVIATGDSATAATAVQLESKAYPVDEKYLYIGPGTPAPTPDHQHTASTEWTSDGTYHWHTCANCNEDVQLEKAAHKFDENGVCECGYKDPNYKPEHQHTASTEWKYDGTNHWHTCTNCDVQMEKAAHKFDKNGVCECGYKDPNYKPEHQHTASTEWTSDSTYHWHTCTNCNEDVQLEKAAHKFDENGVCECGYKDPNYKPEHQHTASTEWKYDGTNHWHTCTNCDVQMDKAPHNFGEDGKAEKCVECGFANPDYVAPDPDDTGTVDSGSDAGGAVAAVLVGGAAVWGGYEIATRVILHNILPEGAAIPANRGQLALLVWNNAGRPEPAAQPAFADVDDADMAKAAQWCVEQGIMEAKTAETFKPEGWTPKLKVIEVWNKAFPKQ